MPSAALFLRIALSLACARGAPEPPATCPETVELVVKAGRPLRVKVDARVRVKEANQPIMATLVEPLYAYDRVVVPEGTRVVGHIEELQPLSTKARLVGILRLDFSPPRRVVLQFDRLVLADGREMLLSTRVGPGTAEIVLQRAEQRKKKDVISKAAEEVSREARKAVDEVRRPGRAGRLKHALVMSLPFHGQYLLAGTVYDAELLAPLDFGTAEPTPRGAADTPPPPDSVLNARLLTGVDSGDATRGTVIEAVLTRPLLSARQELLLPEGTKLKGEVTFARPARSLRRHGALRLLFDTVEVPEQAPQTLLASLHSAEVARNARLAIDDEGGATITNPKARFVAPTLAIGALAATQLMEPVTEPGVFEPGVLPGAVEPNSIGSAASGYSGFRLTGIVLAFVSRPAALGLGVVGVAGSLYWSYLGKGREVSFPAGTRIQVQLASDSASESRER